MLKKIFGDLNKRKVKVFSLFLLCSFLAWFLSNLSQSYESRADFTLRYKNLPDTLLLGNGAVSKLEAKLMTSGFQFLYYNFTNKTIEVDLSEVINSNGTYLLTANDLKKQVERQLSNNISLIDLDRERLVVDLYKVASKEVDVILDMNLQFEQNHILNGQPKVTPQKIVVKGPKSEIDRLNGIHTSKIELNNLSTDFSEDVLLIFPNGMDNSIFSESRVNVSGNVVRFSEVLFEVPITPVNLPEGYNVKLFPNTTKVLCKATVERLKTLGPQDFEIISDYAQRRDNQDNTLFLEIQKEPVGIFDVRLQENKVSFILEKQ